MKGNNDKQMAVDFDTHLKLVMSQLSKDLAQDKSQSKDLCILKSKQSLMSLLVSKTVEYLKAVDTSSCCADVVFELT